MLQKKLTLLLRILSSVTIFLLSQFLPSPSWAEIKEVRIKVDGLSCPFCVKGLQMKLEEVPSLQEFKMSYKQGYVRAVLKQGSVLDIPSLREAIRKSGFTLSGIDVVVVGEIVDWQGSFAIRATPLDQVFLLYEGDETHEPSELLSLKRQQELEVYRQSKKKVQIRGSVHEHGELPPSLAIKEVQTL